MTIQTTTSFVTTPGTGVQTLFTFSFVWGDASWISVVYTDPDGVDYTLASSDYTLTLNPPAANAIWGVGGSVTYQRNGAPIPVGSTLTIRRTLPDTQVYNFLAQQGFNPRNIEAALDRLCMVSQQTARDFIRDADGQRIENVGDPVAPTDAANAQWVEAFVTGVLNGGGTVLPEVWNHLGDGVTTTFSVPSSESLAPTSTYLVSIDGVMQTPYTDYDVDQAAETITFIEAPPDGSHICVRAFGYASAAVPTSTEWVTPTDVSSSALAAAVASGNLVAMQPTTFTIFPDDVYTILKGLDRVWTADGRLDLPEGIFPNASGPLAVYGPGNANIDIYGATPVNLTFVSVDSVTGTAGNWSVTYNVVDASAAVVGYYIKNYEWAPLPLLGGDNSVFRPRVVANELLHTSAVLGSITTSGSSAVFSSGTPSTVISVGDILTVKGQSRNVTVVDDGTRTLTLDAAWDKTLAGSRDYYLSIPNSGTVSTAGVLSAAVVGTGTAFTTQANVGDLLIADGTGVRITAITDDLNITVSPAINLAALTKYTIHTQALPHEGIHKITAVVGNKITVLNKCQARPPINAVVPTAQQEMKLIRTVLQQLSTDDGFKAANGGALRYVNNIVLEGSNNSSGNHGIAGNGRFTAGPTQEGTISNFTAGDAFGVSGWGRGIFFADGCNPQLRKVAASGNHINLWLTGSGARANLREFANTGAGNRGIIIGPGSFAQMTESRSCGCVSDNIFCLGEIYAEIPFNDSAGSMGIRLTDNNQAHLNEGTLTRAAASGLYGQHGTGDISRCYIVANAREGVEIVSRSDIIAEGAWITGSRGTAGRGSGIYAQTKSVVTGPEIALVGNAGENIYALSGAEIEASNGVNRGGTYAARAVNPGTDISITNTYFSQGTAISATEEAIIHVFGSSGSLPATRTPATLNQEGTDGFAMISAGGDVGRVPKYSGIDLTGQGNVTIAPTAPGTGTINNVVIGGTTPLAGTFTTLTGTTQIVGHANNTAGTPAYTFAGNTNTGFYRIASNRVGLALNGSLVVDFQTGGLFVTGIASYTSTNASAFVVGRVPSSTPALQVDASAATSITGVKVTARASAGGVDLGAIGETNVNLRIDAAGSGTITLNGTGTGAVSTPRAFTAASGTAPAAGGSAGLGLLMSSTANLGIFFGSGAPTISAAQGSLYLRTDGSSTSTRLYVNTNGSTGWTNVTTAT